MNRRRIPRELRPERAPGGLRRALRWLAIGAAVVLVATAAIPAVGVLIAVVFWLLLAAVLGVASAVAAGPVRRWAPVLVGRLMTGLAPAARWSAAHSPRWLLVPLAALVRLPAALLPGLLGWLLRRSRRRRRELVPAIALPRVPVAALPPALPPPEGEPWTWAA